MDYDKIRTKIKVPPELQDVYQRGVISAMKILFGEKTHNMLIESLEKPKGAPIGKIVGDAAAGTLGMVVKISKGKVPAMLTLPLGVEIVLQIFQFLEDSQMAQPTPEDFGDAMGVMITIVLGKIQEGEEMGAQPQPQPGQPPAPPQGQPPQPMQPPQPQGMINQGAPA